MIIKRLTAAVLTVAMAATAFTGCSETFEKVVTVDGVDITPGHYLFAQYEAYLEAGELVGDSTVDLLNTVIEDTDSKEWIHNETIENLKVYVWTENTFEKMGLELAQEELDYINSQAEYYWPFVQESYVPNGIGEETYRKTVTNSYKLEKIFSTIYGEGGEKEPSDQEYKEFMSEKYARIKGFELSKIDSLQMFATAEELAQIVLYCEEAVNALNNGADFEETQVKYMTLVGEIHGDETDYSETPAKHTINRFLSKGNVESGEELLTANAFLLDMNSEFVYDETEKDFVIYQRVENTSSDAELDYYKSSLISEMKSDEFTAYIEGEAALLEVIEDAAAVKYHSVSNIQ